MLRFLPALFAACFAVGTVAAQGMSGRPIPPPTFPSVHQPWSLADVRQAAVVLHKMAQEKPADLPHYSIGSRSIFGRLTSPGVLDAESSLPAHSRLMHHDRVVRVYEQIFLIYVRLQAQRGGYDTDVAELAGLLLRATNRMAQDLEEARAEVADTSRAAFEEGDARLTDGMVQTMIGVLEMAADADALSLNARQRLLIYATRASAPIARALSAAQRAEVSVQIDALLQRDDLDELEEDLQALREPFASN